MRKITLLAAFLSTVALYSDNDVMGYYKTLGVSSNASSREVRKAYEKIMHRGRKNAKDKVGYAYLLFRDPSLRDSYNRAQSKSEWMRVVRRYNNEMQAMVEDAKREAAGERFKREDVEGWSSEMWETWEQDQSSVDPEMQRHMERVDRERQEGRRKAREEQARVDRFGRDVMGYYELLGVSYRANDLDLERAYNRKLEAFRKARRLDLINRINDARFLFRDSYLRNLYNDARSKDDWERKVKESKKLDEEWFFVGGSGP